MYLIKFSSDLSELGPSCLTTISVTVHYILYNPRVFKFDPHSNEGIQIYVSREKFEGKRKFKIFIYFQ